MNYSVSSQIKCPFFKREAKNLLCCEGYIEGTCMTTSFRSRGAALQYISDNCSEIDGGSCPMAKNLYEKYRLLELEEERKEREWYEKLSRIRGLQSFALPAAAMTERQEIRA